MSIYSLLNITNKLSLLVYNSFIVINRWPYSFPLF